MNEGLYRQDKKAGLDHSHAGGNTGSGADVLARKFAAERGGCTMEEDVVDGGCVIKELTCGEVLEGIEREELKGVVQMSQCGEVMKVVKGNTEVMNEHCKGDRSKLQRGRGSLQRKGGLLGTGLMRTDLLVDKNIDQASYGDKAFYKDGVIPASDSGLIAKVGNGSPASNCGGVNNLDSVNHDGQAGCVGHGDKIVGISSDNVKLASESGKVEQLGHVMPSRNMGLESDVKNGSSGELVGSTSELFSSAGSGDKGIGIGVINNGRVISASENGNVEDLGHVTPPRNWVEEGYVNNSSYVGLVGNASLGNKVVGKRNSDHVVEVRDNGNEECEVSNYTIGGNTGAAGPVEKSTSTTNQPKNVVRDVVDETLVANKTHYGTKHSVNKRLKANAGVVTSGESEFTQRIDLIAGGKNGTEPNLNPKSNQTGLANLTNHEKNFSNNTKTSSTKLNTPYTHSALEQQNTDRIVTQVCSGLNAPMTRFTTKELTMIHNSKPKSPQQSDAVSYPVSNVTPSLARTTNHVMQDKSNTTINPTNPAWYENLTNGQSKSLLQPMGHPN